MKHIIIFIFGILSYLLFLASVIYAIAFLNNSLVPTGIDTGASHSLAETLLVDLGLIALFGFVHSLMARKRFKAWWTRIIPQAAERSVHVLQSSLFLMLIFWQWRPLPTQIWSASSELGRPLILALHLLGWLMVILATFLINHFHFSGLQQVFNNLRGKALTSPKFVTPLLYKVVRHPLQLGLLIAFWVTPDMTIGRLLFAAAMSIYILIGLHFEERDLEKEFGRAYQQYRQTTPKLLPTKSITI
jgi:protein-S-isoprenylcysteine O-methyltransferase Ste14